MFLTPKSIDKTVCYPFDNKLVYSSDYKSVMQFIRANKKIPLKLANFEKSQPDQDNVKELHDSIQSGDLSSTVFSHPDCQSYSLYLLKNEKISITDFLTINIYLVALMQFTNIQPLKKEGTDDDVRRNTEVKVISVDEVKPLVIDGLKKIHFNSHFYASFDLSEFENNINELNKFDKTVIAIKRPYSNDIIDKSMNEFSSSSPLMFKDKDYYYVISAALVNTLLSSITRDFPVKVAPIFGTVGLHTLYRLHQHGYHPVNLYSIDVISNPEEIHYERVGPLLTLLHDLVVHIYWANLLNKNQYSFVYDYLIPKTAEVLTLNMDDIEKQATRLITDNPTLFKLVDLDISNNLSCGAKIDSNIYLYECIKHALSDHRENMVTVFNTLYEERELIEKKYGINIEAIFKLPFFNEGNLSPLSGLELLESRFNKLGPSR